MGSLQNKRREAHKNLTKSNRNMHVSTVGRKKFATKSTRMNDICSSNSSHQRTTTRQPRSPNVQCWKNSSWVELRNLRGSHSLFASACSTATLDLGGRGGELPKTLAAHNCMQLCCELVSVNSPKNEVLGIMQKTYRV